MSSVKELTEVGQNLGLEGDKLLGFIREEQAKERQDRLEAREVEKEKADRLDRVEKEKREQEKEERASEEKIRLAQVESEKLDKLADREERASEEKIRLADKLAEREQRASEEKIKLAQVEAERVERLERLEVEKLGRVHEARMAELRNEHDIELARAEHGVGRVKEEESAGPKVQRGPKLPTFDEDRDNMDSYLARFERYAEVQRWAKPQWAVHLSALLKGKALDVYSRLSSEDALCFETLKSALLKRFELTEEGFRRKFKSCRPEQGETFVQYASRAKRYLSRWFELGKVEQTFEGVTDYLLRDQLLTTCSRELYVHLREKVFPGIHEMAVQADYFAEARGGTKYVVQRDSKDNRSRSSIKPRGQESSFRGGGGPKVSSKFSGRSGRDSGRDTSRDRSRSSDRRSVICYHCGAAGHVSTDCPNKGRQYQAASVEVGDRRDMDQRNVSFAGEPEHTEDGQRDFYGGRGRNRSRGNTYRGRSRPFRGRGRGYSPYPSEDQGSFCVVENTEEAQDVTLICAGQVVQHSQTSGSCKFTGARLPVAEGLLNGQVVTVMRDTGCTGVVVRRSLVPPEQMLDKVSSCMLVDKRRMSRVPVARITLDTPFFKGETDALCMSETLYDVTLGNIDGSLLPKIDDFDGAVSLSVETRSQALTRQEPYRKLNVPAAVAHVSRDEFKQEQASDVTLTSVRTRAADGTRRISKNGNVTTFFYHKDLLYRSFESAGSGRTFRQVVVPSKLRQTVMKVAHESIMSGHLGTRKTSDRVLAELFWPGVCGDVMRYCRSCDICQRTVAKGRVTKIPIGSMPLIDTPFKRVAVDIVGPIFPATDRKNKYILTLVDYATRYPEAIALPSIETERVAEALVDMFSRLGIPEELLTDRGSQFTSDIMKEISSCCQSAS